MGREFGHIPEAWPALLDRAQLAAYVGFAEQTLMRILPVRPVDCGIRGTRWKRREIDEWIDNLPHQLPGGKDSAHVAAASTPADGEHDPAEERRAEALARVKARALKRVNRGKGAARPARQEA